MELDLDPGEGLLVRTPCYLSMAGGDVDVWGLPLEGGQLRIGIPELTLLVTARSRTTLRLEAVGHRIVRNPIPEEWWSAAEKARDAERVVILGETDSGKSGLLFYLANVLSISGLRVGIVDSDLGQKDLGPPATVAAAAFASPPLHPGLAEPEFLYFVGDTSPRGHLLQVVAGVRSSLDYLGRRPDVTLVNTSGYVSGSAARALKYHKLEVIRPDLVFVIGDRGEVSHLPRVIPPGPEVQILPGPPSIIKKDRSRRYAVRRARWIRYLSGASETKVDFSEVRALGTLLFTGRPSPAAASLASDLIGREINYLEISPDVVSILVEGGLSRAEIRALASSFGVEVRAAAPSSYDGLLVGLMSETGGCLGLGLLSDLNPGEMRGSVISRVKKFAYVKFGYIRLSRSLEEIGRREVAAP